MLEKPCCAETSEEAYLGALYGPSFWDGLGNGPGYLIFHSQNDLVSSWTPQVIYSLPQQATVLATME